MPSGANQEALEWIDRWPDWPAPALILHGPQGCGKTHLLSLWQEKAGPKGQALDDAERFFGDREAEENLFHAYNLAKENNSYLMLTMHKPTAQQPIALPDLASRLRSAPHIAVHEPDDATLQAIIVKLMNDRQMTVAPEVVHYILPRIERSYSAVIDLIEKIDTISLSEKRAVTIPFVKPLIEG